MGKSGGTWGVTDNVYRLSFWGDGNVRGDGNGGGDGCTTLRTY